jgi:hypothetical protein
MTSITCAKWMKQKGQPDKVSYAITEGNPGALHFLLYAYKQNPLRAEICFTRMQKAGITGSKLYMLWNDCCNRDVDMSMRIMSSTPVETILEHINYENGRGIPFHDSEEQ